MLGPSLTIVPRLSLAAEALAEVGGLHESSNGFKFDPDHSGMFWKANHLFGGKGTNVPRFTRGF